MESSESPEDPVGADLRDPRPATQELTTRGRKRASAALTTARGVPARRDRSRSFLIDFKRPRALPPAEGAVFRDRSNDRDLDFKRPSALPKRRRRRKRVVAKGNTPPPAAAVSVSAGEIATPTPTSAPPTLPLAPPTHTLSKAWADYDEEDDRRVYEEDPSTLFSDSPSSSPDPPHSSPYPPRSSPAPPRSSPAPPHSSPDPPHSSPYPPRSSPDPPHSSPAPPHSSPDPPHSSPAPPHSPPAPPLTCSSLSSEEQVDAPLCLPSSVEEEHPALSPPVSLFSPWRWPCLYSYYIDRKLMLEIEKCMFVQLLRREEQKRDEQTDFEELFREIEKMKYLRSRHFLERNTDSSLFSEELDVKVDRFLFLGDQRGLREETERLCRYKRLLMEWTAAFRGKEHGVSAWVGDLLEEMLDEIVEDISYVIRLGKMTPQCLPSKHGSGLSLSAFRELKKRGLEMIKLHITGSRRRRCVEERNTRKWLRHVHARRAAVTQGRSRRRLKAIGHKLCSHFSRHSGLKPADTVPHNSA